MDRKQFLAVNPAADGFTHQLDIPQGYQRDKPSKDSI